MNNNELATFIDISKTSSFAKTANNLYISRSAVMQQMNTLEANLKVKLLNRNTSGTTLTKAGRAFLPLAQNMIKQADKSYLAMNKFRNAITIGTIWLNDLPEFEKKLPSLEKKFSHLSINFEQILDFQKIPGDVDLIETVGSQLFSDPNFAFKSNDKGMPLVLGVPANHYFTTRKMISVSTLGPTKIYTAAVRITCGFQNVVKQMRSADPDIKIVDAKLLNQSFFNSCTLNKRIILIPKNLKKFCPSYHFLDLKENYSLPYGFYYRKTENPVLKELLKQF